GQRVDPDAEFTNGVRLLVDLAVDAAGMQHERGGQTADAAADNDDFHRSTHQPTRNSVRYWCARFVRRNDFRSTSLTARREPPPVPSYVQALYKAACPAARDEAAGAAHGGKDQTFDGVSRGSVVDAEPAVPRSRHQPRELRLADVNEGHVIAAFEIDVGTTL